MSKVYERQVQANETLLEVAMLRLLIALQGQRSERLPKPALM